MAARVATYWAIVLGGGGGAVAALLGSSGAPSPAPSPAAPAASLPLRPLGEIAAQVHSAQRSASAEPVASTEPTVSAAPPASASPSAAPQPAAELLPLPTTKEKLLRAEMHCDQRKAEDCIVAARSFETGSTGVTDPEKAAKYRKIALTAWISQCDHNSAASCFTLATMYRAGSGVPQSDRNADALIARARELCRFNDAPVCHELPAP